jgi:hypothetical protein
MGRHTSAPRTRIKQFGKEARNNGRKRCPIDGKLINHEDDVIYYALLLSRWQDGTPVRVYDCEHGYGCHLTTKATLPKYITPNKPQYTRKSPQRAVPAAQTRRD